MTELLGAASAVFTQAITMVATVADTVTTEPVLLLACVGVPLCGIGIGMWAYREGSCRRNSLAERRGCFCSGSLYAEGSSFLTVMRQ